MQSTLLNLFLLGEEDAQEAEIFWKGEFSIP